MIYEEEKGCGCVKEEKEMDVFERKSGNEGVECYCNGNRWRG